MLFYKKKRNYDIFCQAGYAKSIQDLKQLAKHCTIQGLKILLTSHQIPILYLFTPPSFTSLSLHPQKSMMDARSRGAILGRFS